MNTERIFCYLNQSLSKFYVRPFLKYTTLYCFERQKQINGRYNKIPKKISSLSPWLIEKLNSII